MLFDLSKIGDSEILIVDDEPANILIMETAMKDLGHITSTTNPITALELSRKIRPDLILLDLEMPEMNGLEVCRQLKENPETESCMVVFVTSHNEKELEYTSLSYGACDFITKPYDMAVCRMRMSNLLKMRQQEKLIEQSRRELDALVKQVPVFISYWDINWVNQYSNDFSGSWFNICAEDMVGIHGEELLPQDLWQKLEKYSVESFQDIAQFEIQPWIPNSRISHMQANLSITEEKGEKGYLLTLVDISSLKRAKKELFVEKERLRVMLNSIGDAVIATDTEGFVTFINPIAERMTGWRMRDAMGLHIDEVMYLQDSTTRQRSRNPVFLALEEKRVVGMAFNCQIVSQDGNIFRVEDSAAPIRSENGYIIGAIIVFHDVSEAIAMSVKMSFLANHDQLTDLPNRVLLHDRLTQALQVAELAQLKVAVLLIDIDHFKYLNDSLGHNMGDTIIKQLAAKLALVKDPAMTLARVGGDEFMLVLPKTTAEQVQSVTSKIYQVMHQPFQLADQQYSISLSIGISIYPDDAKDEDTLMRHADVAMYRAKHEGRNRFCFFSDDLEKQLLQRHKIELMLREALSREQLEVFYQPKIDLNTGKLCGAEALVRLRNHDGGLVSPIDFIPLAEETGLVVELGAQVLRQACREHKQWREHGITIPISVNIAAAQFAEEEIVESILRILKNMAISPEYLELEVTESALMQDFTKTEQILGALANAGVSIAIDDFGTGYSSLAYLKKFNVDVLKIDQSFVRDMLSNGSDLDIVKTIISLARNMNLKLVAEGIETQEQESILKQLGCGIGQGYWYSKPLPADSFLKFALSTATFA
ncbi:MAG: EAL domain-containing protein [Pseudomonadales bacterium]|uniref:cyclic-guanylate-specific phosphodiesterase n=1 Tax=Oleiphilus messinensis TaxID=141451 RepID=A0A1Y0I8I0_9GAMM|nr:EAL domain-containing protein [Oleiphilus messinensis]ARU56812.1 response regulator receiver and PAS/PAC sensor-containing signal transduction histidine kinase/phosphodiesterase [Oleiphilus messinensis]MCG8613495.1 EAL domain-containing protein [Pseudomonadales bacterium]